MTPEAAFPGTSGLVFTFVRRFVKRLKQVFDWHRLFNHNSLIVRFYKQRIVLCKSGADPVRTDTTPWQRVLHAHDVTSTNSAVVVWKILHLPTQVFQLSARC